MSQVKLVASPMRMRMFSPECQYCGEVDTYYDSVGYEYAMLSCDKHKHLAQRDAKAWCHEMGYVRFVDAVKDPLFVESDLLSSPIKVRRSNGMIQDGWSLALPSYTSPCHLTCKDGKWMMHAQDATLDLRRGVLVEDLKLSLPESLHGVVDNFVMKLDFGLYKVDHDAFTTAAATATTATATAAAAARACANH